MGHLRFFDFVLMEEIKTAIAIDDLGLVVCKDAIKVERNAELVVILVIPSGTREYKTRRQTCLSRSDNVVCIGAQKDRRIEGSHKWVSILA